MHSGESINFGAQALLKCWVLPICSCTSVYITWKRLCRQAITRYTICRHTFTHL